MKIIIPEPVSPETLYERNLQFESLNQEDLEDLINGVETALDIVCSKLDKNYSIVEYEIVFFRGNLYDWNLFGRYICGGFDLTHDSYKNFVISDFQEEYKRSLQKVKEDYCKNPGSLRFNGLVRRFRDSISREIEAKDAIF